MASTEIRTNGHSVAGCARCAIDRNHRSIALLHHRLGLVWCGVVKRAADVPCKGGLTRSGYIWRLPHALYREERCILRVGKVQRTMQKR
jgi:hypothetical protein